MNYQEVKQLLDAGFTAEEIRTMLNNPQNPQNNTPEENTNDFVGGSENGSEKSVNTIQDPAGDHQFPAPAEEENPNISNFDRLNATVERLIKTIQASNLQASHVDNLGKPDLDSEVDKIMAGLIRPERNKEE